MMAAMRRMLADVRRRTREHGAAMAHMSRAVQGSLAAGPGAQEIGRGEERVPLRPFLLLARLPGALPEAAGSNLVLCQCGSFWGGRRGGDRAGACGVDHLPL